MSQGQNGQVLEKTPPSFAQWRWGTLHSVCRYFIERSVLLQCIWGRGLFPSVRAPAELNEVDATMSSPLFWHRLRVVSDLVGAFHSLRAWGAGCECHAEERLAGQRQVDCPMQGRRLPAAAERVKLFVEECLAEARSPSEVSFCAAGAGDVPPDLLRERSFGFRRAAADAQRKWKFRHYLPYSLARARDVEVMRACIEEFDSAPPGGRTHRVAKEFFAEESGPRALAEAFVSSGAMAPSLHDALRSIELFPITEERAEAPHAVMHREKLRQKAGCRAWFSANLRLVDNLRWYDAHCSPESGGPGAAIFDDAWSNVWRLVHVEARFAHRCRRVTMKALRSQVYRSGLEAPSFDSLADFRNMLLADAPPVPKSTALLIHTEYMSKLLQLGCIYAAPPEGAPEPIDGLSVGCALFPSAGQDLPPQALRSLRSHVARRCVASLGAVLRSVASGGGLWRARRLFRCHPATWCGDGRHHEACALARAVVRADVV